MSLPVACTMLLGVTLDGEPVAGFPVLRRVTGTDLVDLARTRRGDGAVVRYDEVVPDTGLVLRVAVLTTDGPLTLAVNGLPVNGTPTIPLDGGGLLVLCDTLVNDAAGHLVAANPTTRAAAIRTLVLFDPA